MKLPDSGRDEAASGCGKPEEIAGLGPSRPWKIGLGEKEPWIVTFAKGSCVVLQGGRHYCT